MAPSQFRALLSDLVPAVRQAKAAFVVLALGIAVSFAAWYVTERWVDGQTARKFQATVDQAGGIRRSQSVADSP